MSEPEGPGRQQALPFRFESRCTFASFVVGANSELVGRLRDVPTGEFNLVCVVGGEGHGRSHLLQASCQHAAGRGARVAYLPLAAAPQDADILAGLEAYSLVALDDLDAWLGYAPLERALISLYQALQQRGATLVLSMTEPPTTLECAFEDLASRLRAGATYAVAELDDEDKGRVVTERARALGLELAPNVVSYWLRRRNRDLPQLLADLAVLDEASLSAKRAITVPLVREVLNLS